MVYNYLNVAIFNGASARKSVNASGHVLSDVPGIIESFWSFNIINPRVGDPADADQLVSQWPIVLGGIPFEGLSEVVFPRYCQL